MKKILTIFCLMLCLFATAQEPVDTMYIWYNNNVVGRIAVARIDSVTFVTPPAPEVPDTPVSSHEAVDLGLPSGLKWATCNVGASSPEEYGGYYAWGEIEEKDCYSEDNSVTCGKSMGDISGNPAYDVARARWGGSWRMPTSAEQQELLDSCTWTWTTRNDVDGYEVTGPNGNSIFLPAAGYRDWEDAYVRGSGGDYWSGSVDYDGGYACEMYFGAGGHNVGREYRYRGFSVRPVCDGASVNNYIISVSSNGNGIVTIEGTQENLVTVYAGASVTVTATPDSGYKFIGWYIGESDTPVSTDAIYTFTVSANVALIAKFEAEESDDSGIANTHEAVDLGLSVKWATCNVGASSPEEYGGYYAWGETEEKDSYTWDNSVTYGKSMGDISGNPAYDVARAHWGGSWRMPTLSEMSELCDNCTWTWTTRNEVNGYEVTGPNGNSIFLPAAGYRYGAGVYYSGSNGIYWSGSVHIDNDYNAYYLDFYRGTHYVNSYSREGGYMVRPVSQ